MKERIIFVRPFAYIRLFESADSTIQTKSKLVVPRHLFWRFYWIGVL